MSWPASAPWILRSNRGRLCEWLRLLGGLFIATFLKGADLDPTRLPPPASGNVAVEKAALAKPKADWWSLKPLQRPAVPTTGNGARIANPVDAFVVAKLAEKGLSQSPEADRRTLIRRLYFDLTGLPPTPEEIEAFLADRDTMANERLVDRLLASPRYGERWARHWLDVVHYGETHGYDKDQPRRNAWPFRDYVIRSFNEDKPYSRFVQEQLAGDVLFPDTRDGFEALGFIAAGPWDLIGHVEVPESKIDGKVARHLDRDDMVANTIQTFNSLTVQCAQCHNHKFDPIPQEDYYSLQAVFAAVDRADKRYDTDPAVAQRRRTLIERESRLASDKKNLNDRILAQAGPPLVDLDKRIASLSKAPKQGEALGDPESAARLAAWQKDRTNLIAKATSENDRCSLDELEHELAEVKADLAKLPPQSTAYVAAVHTGSGEFAGTGANNGKPRPIHVLSRGNVQKPGKEAQPGTLSCLTDLPARFELPPEHKEGERRAALARWITDRNNPLTSRSIVNRVWQYHFGRGLVETPNDFGHAGALPTHPELLDWLATEFRDGGQSLKALHRLIVTSATYKQTSEVHPVPMAGHVTKQSAVMTSRPTLAPSPSQADGDNRFLWRQSRRKLEAEALRDAVLLVSGHLDLKMGGPSFQDFVIDKPEHSPHYEYQLHDPEDPKSHRRSIYRFIVRSQQQPFMTALDCADPSMQVGRRNESLSPLQALALLNNSLMLTMSKHFAARLEKRGVDLLAQVRRGFYEAVGRAPSADEGQALTRYAREQGLANFCRVLFNLNEFAFVD